MAVARFSLGDFQAAEAIIYPQLVNMARAVEQDARTYAEYPYVEVLRFLDFIFESLGWKYDVVRHDFHTILAMYYNTEQDSALMVEYDDRYGWIEMEWVKYPLQEMARVD